MRFTGTHIPGAHQVVVPTPPRMVIPERKIISAEEAAKWHGTRGGAVAEAGGILLPGLVGWSLTSGPQQTLSSAGVIASGPLDWIAIGSPTYGASGVTTNGSSTGLQIANTAAIQTGAIPFGFEIWIDPLTLSPAGGGQSSVFSKRNNSGGIEYEVLFEWLVEESIFYGQLQFYINDGGGYPTAILDVSEAQLTARQQIICWVNISALTINIVRNAGSVGSEVITGAQTIVDSHVLTMGGQRPAVLDANGTWGPMRFWKPEDIGATLGNAGVRTWLYNSGTPRTDQEVANYTG